MSSLRRASWAAGLVLAAVTAACGRDTRSAVPARALSAADSIADSVPELPPSIVEAPVRYDIDPAIAELDRAIPRRFGNLDERRQVPGRSSVSYAFVAERAPFEVRVRGNTVTLSSIITYKARGWYKPPIGPSVGGSCGLSGDAPRVRVAMSSTLRLANDWTLHAKTAVPVIEPVSKESRDRCQVTVLNYDVTDRVLAAVRTQLEGKAALLDERVRRLDVRTRVERWWALMGRPIRITDVLWLQLRPDSVRVGSLRGNTDALVVPIGLMARPRIVTGARPDSSTAPLPNIAPGAPGNGGLHVLIEGLLAYDDASRILVRQLVGRRFERAGQHVSVQDARVFGARGGRVGLALRVVGDVDAQVVLVGRPVYDRTSGMLRVPDLDYAVGDASLVVKAGDQVGHDAFRDALRERARWPVTVLLDTARARAERAMNRDLTQGVRLGATLPSARAIGVYAATSGLLVRADASGQLSLDVNRAPTFGRKRRAPTPTADAKDAKPVKLRP